MATSRQVAREKLVTLLPTALVGDGKPVKIVSGSKQASLEGITPLVQVLGQGSNRDPLTFAGDRGTFSFVVRVWVLQSTENWTYAQAENALDSIEALIAGVCEDNDRTDDWELLQYNGPSAVIEVAVAGVPYYLERIPVQVVLGRN